MYSSLLLDKKSVLCLTSGLALAVAQQRQNTVLWLQILEQQHQLSFHLQQQRLIELIRYGKTEEALEHAQEYLAPPGEEDPAFLEELGTCKPSDG